ncbi:MAG: hypothetical protein LBG96_15420 [Tannerella sp.]|nr:hypothetical protein [Tannerella sp.]
MVAGCVSITYKKLPSLISARSFLLPERHTSICRRDSSGLQKDASCPQNDAFSLQNDVSVLSAVSHPLHDASQRLRSILQIPCSIPQRLCSMSQSPHDVLQSLCDIPQCPRNMSQSLRDVLQSLRGVLQSLRDMLRDCARLASARSLPAKRQDQSLRRPVRFFRPECFFPSLKTGRIKPVGRIRRIKVKATTNSTIQTH